MSLRHPRSWENGRYGNASSVFAKNRVHFAREFRRDERRRDYQSPETRVSSTSIGRMNDKASPARETCDLFEKILSGFIKGGAISR